MTCDSIVVLLNPQLSHWRTALTTQPQQPRDYEDFDLIVQVLKNLTDPHRATTSTSLSTFGMRRNENCKTVFMEKIQCPASEMLNRRKGHKLPQNIVERLPGRVIKCPCWCNGLLLCVWRMICPASPGGLQLIPVGGVLSPLVNKTPTYSNPSTQDSRSNPTQR